MYSLAYDLQKGLFCRVSSEVTVVFSLDILLHIGIFLFSYFSSLSFYITLAPDSGRFVGTWEGYPQTITPLRGISRPSDCYAPIQITMHRVKSSLSGIMI